MIMRVQSYLRTHAASIGLVIIALAFMAILVLQAVATNNLQNEVDTQHQLVVQTKTILNQLSTNAATRTAQINALQSHIDCLASFFAQTDRNPKTITNIDACTITSASTGQSSSAPIGSPARTVPSPSPSVSNGTSTPTPVPSATPKAQVPTPSPTPMPSKTIIQRVTNLLNLL